MGRTTYLALSISTVEEERKRTQALRPKFTFEASKNLGGRDLMMVWEGHSFEPCR
jgi:hypothetical protein